MKLSDEAKSALLAALVTLAVIAVFVSLFFLVSMSLNSLREYMGWQSNAFTAWFLGAVVLLRGFVKRNIWQIGLACMCCNVMAYVAYRMHHENLRLAFDRLGDLLFWVYLIDGDGKWRRRLWNKLKSASLTAISAASFKRQTKEAFM